MALAYPKTIFWVGLIFAEQLSDPDLRVEREVNSTPIWEFSGGAQDVSQTFIGFRAGLTGHARLGAANRRCASGL